ncbi:hypothetical protein EXIGLDRAFT_226318 [Exidia glandulosa HHB12029]|uniref:F-box domain-containing protein n=1 Tax=Exidia glandulosa HHB12029 TaxID=1314781 RepID=A0A165E923_EXIGL|nr:hypothetical protein EXIGLDRAFT_226318 [Exidia glandulosa HHB12029]
MLATLAPEVLLDVFAFLDYADLRALALVNSAFNALASRVLYRRVVVTGKVTTFAPIHNLFLLLATRRYPARYVHWLHLDFFARSGCIVTLPPDMPPLVSAACASMTNLTSLHLGECFDSLLRPAVQHSYFPNLHRLSLHSYSEMESFVARHAGSLTHFQCVWPLPLDTPHFARMTHFEGSLHNAAVACRQESPLVEITSGNFLERRFPMPRQMLPCAAGFAALAQYAPHLRRVRLYHYGSAGSLAHCFAAIGTPLLSVRDLELQFASPGLDAVSFHPPLLSSLTLHALTRPQNELVTSLPFFLAVFPNVQRLRLHPLFSLAKPCSPCPVQFCKSIAGVARDLRTLIWATRAMTRKPCGSWVPVDEGEGPGPWTPIIAVS